MSQEKEQEKKEMPVKVIVAPQEVVDRVAKSLADNAKGKK
jgi:hypothetical protein